MTRAELAELIGVALTQRLRQVDMWSFDETGGWGIPGVRVRALAAAVAGDIFEQVRGTGNDTD